QSEQTIRFSPRFYLSQAFQGGFPNQVLFTMTAKHEAQCFAKGHLNTLKIAWYLLKKWTSTVYHPFKGKWCPERWKLFGSSCYYESTEKKNWTDSRSFCQDKGFDLVVVNSKEEQVGVFTLVPSSFLCLGFSTCMFSNNKKNVIQIK
uniref:C-type lectin domain-containing protein n=1 Tax=Oryzias latipes TaxID=8090 RepID=A0A3P9ILM2_ORYLA